MVSLITASFPAHFTVSHTPFSDLNPSPRFFSVGLVISPPRRKRVKQGKQNRFLFEFSECCCSGVVRMSKRDEGEGEQAFLEMELLEFMKNSSNPDMFPSKIELIRSGRADLVQAIEKGGGWMSMGWQDDDDEGDKVEIEDGLVRNWEFDFGQNGHEVEETRSGSELNEEHDPEGISFMGNSSSASSSSGHSLEMARDDNGIDGILRRLEMQRSLSFGLNGKKNDSIDHVSVNVNEDGQSAGMPKDVENSRHAERNVSSSFIRADAWKTWSIQKAGVPNTEFEDFGGKTNGRIADTTVHDIMVVTTDIKELLDKTKDLDSCAQEINQIDVKSRLQHLELELSSVLRSLRSNTSGSSEKGKERKEHMSEELRQLSDATEFQENEIMNAQDKLRSIRAKLAVLEAKMALALTDAQKVLDERQKRIDSAHKALQLLRTSCIVWANSGSEVLLTGSFDGWATQRKMEKSSSGVFSLSLKLYPGQYEIKFIVDGSWKVDPLRPIVNHSAFENNLLIVS